MYIILSEALATQKNGKPPPRGRNPRLKTTILHLVPSVE